MPANHPFGLAHLWQQSDAVIQTVALILLVMSVASWYFILGKSWQVLRLRRNAALEEAFWNAGDLNEAVGELQQRAPASPLTTLAARGAQAGAHHDRHLHNPAWNLGGGLDRSEFLTRALRQSISRSQARLEAGLTVLASVGSTAPFVGLFGTVWGIYHALVNIGVSGQATLDKVAGPVGEALIMTALGLAVAIPAVLAYNAFTRANRLLLAELDAFAHDLLAYLTTGARMHPGSQVKPLRATSRKPEGIAAAQPAGAA
jgi:biopolymer transport protein ExbB